MKPVCLPLALYAVSLLNAGPAAAQLSSTSTSISQTKIALVNQSAQGGTYSYTFSLAFPTKTTGTLVVTIKANQRYTPSTQERKSASNGAKIYGLTFSSLSQGNQSTDTLKFFVPYSSLPADLARQMQAAANPPVFSRGKAHLVDASYATNGQQSQPGLQQYREGSQENQEGTESGGSEGFWEEADQTIVEAAGEQGEQALQNQAGLGQGTGSGAGEGAEGGAGAGIGTPLMAVLSGLYDINKALNMSAKDEALLEQMLAYIDCGKNPSVFSPMASQNNEELVNQAQSILSEAVQVVVVQSLVSMAGTGVGLISGEGAPILLGKAAASGGFGLLGNMYDQLLKQYLQDIANMFKNCKGTWYGTFRVTTTIPGPGGPTFFYDSGIYHLTTQLGNNLKGTVTGQGKFTQGGALPGEGTFSYTGTMYGETDPGVQQWGQPADASSNQNAVLNTGPVTPPMFNVHWSPAPEMKELNIPVANNGTMPTPTYGSLKVQLQDGVESSGEAPPPGSQFYNMPGTEQFSYRFTVHKLR